MTRLILMRHGNTFEEGQIPVQAGARTDLALTVFGRLQADKIAHYLISHGMFPKAIFTGLLQRQAESAGLIGKRLEMPFQYISALTEIDYGLWEGMTGEQIETKWPKEYTEWNIEGKWQEAIFGGVEQGHRKALEDWFQGLIKNYPNQMILGITSNGILRLFRKEKVKTGHFCELSIKNGWADVISWNQKPV